VKGGRYLFIKSRKFANVEIVTVCDECLPDFSKKNKFAMKIGRVIRGTCDLCQSIIDD